MSPERWAAAWHDMPLGILPSGAGDGLRETVVEIGEPRAVDVGSFATLSRNCPYGGMEFSCWPVASGPVRDPGA